MGDSCLYPDETWVKNDQGKMVKMFRLLFVTRNKPGYVPSVHGLFPTIQEAWKKAMWENIDIGVYSEEEVLNIVRSSIAAQDKKDGTNLLGA